MQAIFANDFRFGNAPERQQHMVSMHTHNTF